MRRFLTPAAALALFVVAGICAASASPWAIHLREGRYTLAPFSFAQFCLDYPTECPAAAGAAQVPLNRERMAELAEVNRAVNAAIRPEANVDAIAVWKLDVTAGDCNAYAVQKRHELMRRGWPAASLALTVVRTRRSDAHLVVTVRTDLGDLVLDNLRPNIVSWRRAGYEWVMRQSQGNPQFWVTLDNADAASLPLEGEPDEVGGVS